MRFIKTRKAVGIVSSVALAFALVPAIPAGAAQAQSGSADSANEAAPGEEPLSLVEESDGSIHLEGQLIVTYKKGASKRQRNLSMKTIEAQDPVSTQTLSKADEDKGASVLVDVQDENEADALSEKLEDAAGVADVQPNFFYQLRDLPESSQQSEYYQEVLDSDTQDTVTNDKYQDKQYYLNAVGDSNGSGANLRKAWSTTKTEGSVTIAILDTGCDADHEDLKDNLNTQQMATVYPDAYGLSEDDEEISVKVGDMSDPHGHGTHCAGIAGAVANNEVGIVGSSYNAEILPMKVFFRYITYSGSVDYGTDSAHLSAAFDYLDGLMDDGTLSDLHVISMSLGGYGREDADKVVEDDISMMKDEHEVISCIAGGNGDEFGNPITDKSWPSDYSDCLAVTALDRNGNNAYWSDYNQYKDISAPGVDIFSSVSPAGITRVSESVTGEDGRSYYGMMSGTSMATPLVAGICSVLWAYNPDLTVDEVTEAIKSTAHPLDSSSQNYHSPEETGSAGAVDAAAALEYVEENHPYSGVPRVSVRDAEVSAVSDQTYTGSEVTPVPETVKVGDKTLQLGTDYKIAYSNNVNAGTATLTVVGIGDYKGRKSATFKIAPADLSSGILKADELADEAFTGAQITPKPTLRAGDSVAEEGVDYDLSWGENVNVGTGTITVTGRENSNFTGSMTVEFKIVPRDVKELSVSSIESQIYTGSALEPEPVVKMGDITLVRGTDYELSFKDNTNVGTGKVTIAGKGSYSGVTTANFTIEPRNIREASISEVGDLSYTGSSLRPKPVVSYAGRTLSEGVDYELSYRHNTALGTAQLVVTGKGNFTDYTSSEFGIIASQNFEIIPLSAADYTGNTVEPEVTVVSGSKVLTEGTDYVVTYRNNTNVGLAQVIVTGVGNYSGQKTTDFPIVARSLANADVSVSASLKYTGSALTPAPRVVLNGFELTNGTDYVVSYRDNVKPGKATLTISGVGNYVGTRTANFTITAPKTVKLAKMAKPKVKVGKKRMKVTWTKVASSTGYQISYRVKGKKNWKTVTVKKGKQVSKTIKKLKKGKKYQVKIRAIATVGGKTYKGAYSKVRVSKKVK
ncbi:MAG: S8 family serine peptidase [Coriobacteriales bacterium]|jgi:subtilisin family serine protease